MDVRLELLFFFFMCFNLVISFCILLLRSSFLRICDFINAFSLAFYAQAVMNKVKGNFFKSLMVNAMGVEVFTNRTVQGLLWGYEDALLTKVSANQPDVETTFGLMYKVRQLQQTVSGSLVSPLVQVGEEFFTPSIFAL